MVEETADERGRGAVWGQFVGDWTFDAAVTVVGTGGLVLHSILGLTSTVVLYVLAAVTAAGASMSAPVRMAIIPRLVGNDLLPAASRCDATDCGGRGVCVGTRVRLFRSEDKGSLCMTAP